MFEKELVEYNSPNRFSNGIKTYIITSDLDETEVIRKCKTEVCKAYTDSELKEEHPNYSDMDCYFKPHYTFREIEKNIYEYKVITHYAD